MRTIFYHQESKSTIRNRTTELSVGHIIKEWIKSMRCHVFQYFVGNDVIFFILQKWARKSANSSQKCSFKFNLFVFFGNKLFRGEANFPLVISGNVRGCVCNGCRVTLPSMHVILSISLVKFCNSRYGLDQRNFLVRLISYVENLCESCSMLFPWINVNGQLL